MAIAKDGAAVGALLRPEQQLMLRLLPDGTEQPFAAPPALVEPGPPNFTALREEALAGRVPAFLKNAAYPVLAGDGGVWVILQAAGRIERFGPDGRLRWALPLAEPEFDLVHEEFVRRNREEAERSSPGGIRLVPFRYLLMGVEDQDTLWTLVNLPESEDPLLLKISPEGKLAGRIRVRGAHRVDWFALDPRRRILLLLNWEDGVVTSAALTASNGPIDR